MSQEAVMTAPLSRPKVHRLPVAASRFAKTPRTVNIPLLIALGLGVTLIAASHLISKDYTANPAMAELPGVLPAIKISSSPEISDKTSATIVIKGQEGTIVGQMARIPAQNQPITEVKTVSNVDKSTGRELLSIVNKY